MDDLISRQTAIYNLANIAKNCAKSDKQKALMGRCIYMIENMPSVFPEQKTGRWVLNKHTDTVLCSQCGKCYGDEYNYCPNCGTRMERENSKSNE